MDAWVIAIGDYPDERLIGGVSVTIEAGIKLMEEEAGENCIFKWDAPIREDADRWSVRCSVSGNDKRFTENPDRYHFSRHPFSG